MRGSRVRSRGGRYEKKEDQWESNVASTSCATRGSCAAAPPCNWGPTIPTGSWRWGPPYVRPWNRPGPVHPASGLAPIVSDPSIRIIREEDNFGKESLGRVSFRPGGGRPTDVDAREKDEEYTTGKMKVNVTLIVILALGLVDAARRRVRSTTATVTMTTTPASFDNRQFGFVGQPEGQSVSGSRVSSFTSASCTTV